MSYPVDLTDAACETMLVEGLRDQYNVYGKHDMHCHNEAQSQSILLKFMKTCSKVVSIICETSP